MPTEKKALKVYVTDEEFDVIRGKAELCGSSVSTYLKEVGLNHKLTSRVDAQAAAILFKANADLGRLGGLFKLAITENRARLLTQEFRNLLMKIERSQSVVAVHCREVAESFKKKNVM